MEYREPSRIVASERRADGLIEDADSPSRLRRFEFVRRTGRLDARRLLGAFLLASVALVVVLYVGRQALDGMVSWLHRQPRYQIRFDQIQLATPPPDCFRGGAPAFLERVRKTANEPEKLSVLDLKPDQIVNAFKRFPWVENVESAAVLPGGIEVRLAYNEPAAIVQVAAGVEVVLDRHGVLLPLEDIDTARIGRPIRITGTGVVAPASTRIGLVWKTETPEQPELAKVDRRILQAAKLAGFFMEPKRMREAESAQALRMLVIFATDRRGLFVQNSENAMLLWGEAPGEEKSDEPSADEKWRILAAKAKSNALEPQKKPGFWTFSHNDMLFAPTGPRP
ncbi:MAG: hypothetical protein P4L85_00295 [Paludisphaera borealis]|uniref:cell division protein FtsQ/DivIB n=1 Tax=Paludisphaera borealis TaxID=1387353 RepID=UPI0028506540|nr:hypothetical protein [Paludisphaera borealis]MDR3617764.1 hypothetical protein [Paludisphaera borealis]